MINVHIIQFTSCAFLKLFNIISHKTYCTDINAVNILVIGQPSRNPTNPDVVPIVFSHRAVPESILQEKVQRHQRLLERKENIAKNESD